MASEQGGYPLLLPPGTRWDEESQSYVAPPTTIRVNGQDVPLEMLPPGTRWDEQSQSYVAPQ